MHDERRTSELGHWRDVWLVLQREPGSGSYTAVARARVMRWLRHIRRGCAFHLDASVSIAYSPVGGYLLKRNQTCHAPVSVLALVCDAYHSQMGHGLISRCIMPCLAAHQPICELSAHTRTRSSLMGQGDGEHTHGWPCGSAPWASRLLRSTNGFARQPWHGLMARAGSVHTRANTHCMQRAAHQGDIDMCVLGRRCAAIWKTTIALCGACRRCCSFF